MYITTYNLMQYWNIFMLYTHATAMRFLKNNRTVLNLILSILKVMLDDLLGCSYVDTGLGRKSN